MSPTSQGCKPQMYTISMSALRALGGDRKGRRCRGTFGDLGDMGERANTYLVVRIGPMSENMWCYTPLGASAAKSAATKPETLPQNPQGLGTCSRLPDGVISAGQLRHGSAMHASDCTDWNLGASSAVHPRASFTRPSSKLQLVQGSAR